MSHSAFVGKRALRRRHRRRRSLIEPLEVRRLLTAGQLDSTFDADGVKLDAVNAGQTVTPMPNGQILVAGFGYQKQIALLSQSGAIDTLFVPPGDLLGGVLNFSDSLVQPDGKIVLLGWRAQASPYISTVEVIRLNADGTYDTTFGGGDGKVVFDQSYSQFSREMAIQPDGKLLIAVGTDADSNVARVGKIARLLPDGSLDQTFGAGGIASTIINGQPLSITGMALEADGGIVVAGARNGPSGQSYFGPGVMRFTSAGVPDNSFGAAGAFTSANTNDTYADVAVEADGTIIAVGQTSAITGSDTLIVKISSTGGGNSRATYSLVNGYDRADQVVLDPKGNIVTVETFGTANSSEGNDGLARFVPGVAQNFMLDTTFNGVGYVVGNWGTQKSRIEDAAIDRAGKIVTAIIADNGGSQTGGVARFQGDAFGSVSGVLYHDLDGDGTRDSNEPALAGRQVYVDINLDGILDGDPVVTTNVDGTYFFTLAQGSYMVREVVPAGWQQTQPSPANGFGGAFSALVANNQSIQNANFGTNVIAAGSGAVAGKVYEDENGDGLGNFNDGQIANRVVYLDANTNNQLDAGELSTTTDLNGRYGFSGLTPGLHRVAIVTPSDWYTTSASSGDVLVSAGAAVNFPFAQFQRMAFNGFVWDDHNADQRRELSEAPLAGWRAYLDVNKNAAYDPQIDVSTLTDGQGLFSFTGLTPADVAAPVRIQNQPGHIVLLGGWSTVPMSGYVLNTEWPVADSTLVSGRVVYSDTAGDPGPKGVPLQTVYADLNNNGSLDGNEPSAMTDNFGNFAIPGLSAGTVFIRTIPTAGYTQTSPADAYQATVNPSGISFGGTFAFSTTLHRGIISGTLYVDVNVNRTRDQGEKPIAGRTVFIDANDNGVLDAGERSTVSDNSGYYLFNELTGGTYTLRQVLPSSWNQTDPGGNANSAKHPVIFTDAKGEQSQISDFGSVPKPGAIRGAVFKDVNGDGIKGPDDIGIGGRTVWIETDFDGVLDPGERTSVTAADGTYAFGDLAINDYLVKEVVPAGWTQTRPSGGAGISLSVGADDVKQDEDFGTQPNAATASAGGPYTVNEGGSTPLSGSGTTSAGANITAYEWDFDYDGISFQINATGQTPAFGASSIDGPATRTVALRVKDSNGTTSAVSTATVTINNVTPSATFTVSPSVNQSDAGTATFSNQSDAFAGDTFTYGYDFDNDNVFEITASASSSVPVPASFLSTVGDHTIHGRITDDDGGFTDYTGVIHVNATGPQQTPFLGQPFAIGANPVTIQAEDFDNGGEGVAYHDVDSANNGGKYRTTAVDVGSTSDAGGGFYVGFVKTGEWLEYTVDVAPAGNYDFAFRVAAAGTNGKFHFEIDGVDKSGLLTVPNTGGWQNWTTVTKTGVALASGQHILRVFMDANGSTGSVGNFNWVKVTQSSGGGGGGGDQTPFHGVPFAINSSGATTLQIEDFDNGGEGVAYHDVEASNLGGASFRPGTGVDLQTTTDTGGGFNLGYVKTGEWLEYTIHVDTAGAYTFDFRLASTGSNAKFHVAIDGSDVTGPLTVPNTGGYQTWKTLTRSGVNLPAGDHVLRIAMDAAGSNGSVGNFNYFKITPGGVGSTTQTIANTVASYAQDGSSAGTNFGSSSQLIVKKSPNAGFTREAYLKFDLSSLTTISNAKLRLWGKLSDSTLASVGLGVYSSADTRWGESTITWNNKPGATTQIGSATITGTTAGWYEIDITSFLAAEKAAGHATVTIVLKSTTTSSGPQTVFNSDDASSNRPEMVVTT